MRNSGYLLLVSGLIGSTLAAMPAVAQQASQAAAAAPAVQDNANTGLSDIIVTARKRVESAQSVPVAITAISAKTIAQRDLTSIEKIASATPDLTVGHASNGSAAEVTLRGIGSSSTSIGIEQSVATVVDGVYYGQGRILEEGFFDLAGVEVLKGPQVLFFGKNATAGVISIKTADPTPRWEFSTKASYEVKGKEGQIEGVASGPITDDLGIRIALRGTKAWGGYYDNVSRPYTLSNLGPSYVSQPTSSDQPGNREFLGRITLKYQPTADITDTLKASFDYNKANNSSYNYVAYNCPTGKTALSGYSCGFNFTTHQNNMPALEAQNFPYAGNGDLYNRYQSAAVTNTFQYELGHATLTNVTNFNYNNNQWLCGCEFDANPGSVFATENSTWKAFSNETRLLTHYDSPINLLVGVLYQKTRRDYAQYVSYSLSNIPSAGADQYQDNDKTSYTRGQTISPYAQVIWKPLATIEVDGGVRYTHETKDSFFIQPYSSPDFFALDPENIPVVAHQRFNNWSPDVNITWKPERDVMVYVAYKTGYKSGGFSNGGVYSSFLLDPAASFSFNPETVHGFEGGVKSTILDNQLRLNFDLYSYKYSDLQVDFFDSTIDAFQTLTADAITKGVEVSFEYAPRGVHGLNLHGSANYNNAHYTNFPDAPCYAGQSPAEGCTEYAAGGAQTGAFNRQNLNGVTLGMAPHWTGAMGLTYEQPVTHDLTAGINADVRYSSSYLISGFGESFSRNPSYALLDVGVHIGPEDGNWQFAVLGKNLTNKQYINGGVDGPNSGGGTGTAAGVHADLFGFGAMPRTVQFQISKKF